MGYFALFSTIVVLVNNANNPTNGLAYSRETLRSMTKANLATPRATCANEKNQTRIPETAGIDSRAKNFTLYDQAEITEIVKIGT